MKKNKKSIVTVVLTLTLCMALVFGIACVATFAGETTSSSDVIGSVTLPTVPSTKETSTKPTGGDISFELGDFNNDGVVDPADAIYLYKNLSDAKTYKIDSTMIKDINRDGKVNTTDAKYLLMYYYFGEDYPLYEAGKYPTDSAK